MNSVKSFEELSALGVEKIHERTHIARDKVEAILTRSYGGMTKIQFMGFISILEREYGVDLGTLREEYTRLNGESGSSEAKLSSTVLHTAPSGRSRWYVLGGAAIAVILGIGYMVQNNLSTEPKSDVIELNPVAPMKVMAEEAKEENLTVEADDQNISVMPEVVSETPKRVPLALSAGEAIKTGDKLVIKPVSRVWIGLIDTDSGTKNQKVTADPIVIDTSKKWLIVLGHGWIDIDTAEGTTPLKERDAVWFAFENGKLIPLSKDEFLERNHGNNW